PPLREQVGQRLTFNEIAHQVGDVPDLTGFVNGLNGWMMQPGRVPRLSQEAIQFAACGKIPGTRNFDGHRAVQFRVTRLEDGAESPFAHLFEQLEPPKFPKRRRRRFLRFLYQLEHVLKLHTSNVRMSQLGGIAWLRAIWGSTVHE